MCPAESIVISCGSVEEAAAKRAADAAAVTVMAVVTEELAVGTDANSGGGGK